jgi:hypothetical protein
MPTINAWDSNLPVELTKGGTNATSFGTATGIVKYDGTSLVTSTTATIDANNLYTNTSQPRFSAYLSATANNVTGAGTVYTIIADTELFDIGANYNNGTGIFTAPKTGVYFFEATARLTGMTTAMTFGALSIPHTSYTIIMENSRPAVTAALMLHVQGIASMTAGQTASVTITVYNGAGDTADLVGGATLITSFSGCLLT